MYRGRSGETPQHESLLKADLVRSPPTEVISACGKPARERIAAVLVTQRIRIDARPPMVIAFHLLVPVRGVYLQDAWSTVVTRHR